MAANEVIDWDEAMEQCGDDEEFLRELLADLRGEIDLQVKRIDEILRRVRFLYVPDDQADAMYDSLPDSTSVIISNLLSFSLISSEVLISHLRCSPTHNMQVPDGAFHQIMKAAHAIKGSASNLMCQQLRQASMALESTAAAANDDAGDPAAVQTHLPMVTARFNELRQAVQNYHDFLSKIGI
mmetsp:Transcript_38384/g.84249  ORF Transcript_38384/g.84249 Transcript_38384/m.84249 type:complete len:183 (-) Transcript_38384:465-1013(-)